MTSHLLHSRWLGLVAGTASGSLVAGAAWLLIALASPWPEVLTPQRDVALSDALADLIGLPLWQATLLIVAANQLACTAIWLLRDLLDAPGLARESIAWALRAWRIPVYGGLAIAAWQIFCDSYVAFRLGITAYEPLPGFVITLLVTLLAPWCCWQHRVLQAPSPRGWWRPGWPGMCRVRIAGYLLRGRDGPRAQRRRCIRGADRDRHARFNRRDPGGRAVAGTHLVVPARRCASSCASHSRRTC